jgi:hypothetical protein
LVAIGNYCSARAARPHAEIRVTRHTPRPSVDGMQVTFTKTDAKRYLVAVDREVSPPLLPRFGPGNDDLVPHDIAHFLVEESYGIRLGVFGQLAAGANGLFFPAPEDRSAKVARRDARIARQGHDDIVRSELLVRLTMAAWEREVGRTWHQGLPVTIDVDPRRLAGTVRRFHEVSAQWSALRFGESLTMDWRTHPSAGSAGSGRSRRHPALG